ncbi:hypothetical protein [Pseudomonas sp.]|uniref:hypothetical protein n=1 Tax=Pseudomonas sp. TaxID=306 RepID=UPI002FC7EA4A
MKHLTRTHKAFVLDMTETMLKTLVEQQGVDADEFITDEIIEYVATECGPTLFEYINFPALKRVDAYIQSDEYQQYMTAYNAFFEKFLETVHADQAPLLLGAVVAEMLNPMDDLELFKGVIEAQEAKEIEEFESQGLEAQISMAVARSKALAYKEEQEEQEEVVQESAIVNAIKNPTPQLRALMEQSLKELTG